MTFALTEVISVVERINDELADHLESCGLEAHEDIASSTYLTFVYTHTHTHSGGMELTSVE